ncbi:acyl carrier protein [uncultured Paraglaciecola sp.]|uniref:acyl carrier protein n=1 Tax=uncultured Paraglaciecola sp. TaxID=1765024 RepID=UPI002595BAE5|nr:acyl carrier protein [uncultured Paraglaciecola sp.]
MDIEQVVRNAMIEVAEISDCKLVTAIEADTVLLESGLDSLGYAMLVGQLEEELGIDPFTEMAITIYPSTFAEFVAIYQQGFARKSA